jgi:hypothetical protein
MIALRLPLTSSLAGGFNWNPLCGLSVRVFFVRLSVNDEERRRRKNF